MIKYDEVIKKYKVSDNDTGSTAVQIILKTALIAHLSEHVKKHKKDKHSTRGLILAVSKRKKLSKYLQRVDKEKYLNLIQDLNLRK